MPTNTSDAGVSPESDVPQNSSQKTQGERWSWSLSREIRTRNVYTFSKSIPACAIHWWHMWSTLINRWVLGVSEFGVLCRFSAPIGSPVEARRSIAMPTRGCGPGRLDHKPMGGWGYRYCLASHFGNVWVALQGLQWLNGSRVVYSCQILKAWSDYCTRKKIRQHKTRDYCYWWRMKMVGMRPLHSRSYVRCSDHTFVLKKKDGIFLVLVMLGSTKWDRPSTHVCASRKILAKLCNFATTRLILIKRVLLHCMNAESFANT